MTQRKSLTDSNVADLEVREKKYEVRDTRLPGLRVRIEVSGRKTFYFVYSILGRVRWYRIGPGEMGAAAARQVAKELIGDVARGRSASGTQSSAGRLDIRGPSRSLPRRIREKAQQELEAGR